MLRPDNFVKDKIQKLLSKIKLIEPNQYFYRDSDLHLTVMSIISCYNGFNLNKIGIEDYTVGPKKGSTFNHWINISDKDFNTMLHLYNSKDFHWSLFIGHIVNKFLTMHLLHMV